MSRKRKSRELSKILVATDFSRGAAYALDRAVRLPLTRGATCHLLHVLPTGIPPTIHGQAEEAARRQLHQATSMASKTAISAGNVELAIRPEIVTGTAYIEIIRHARALAVDLVIIGRHGKRLIRDLFVGSTAVRVICKGDFPVLIVNRKPAHPYLRPLVAVGLEDVSREVLELALRVLEPKVPSVPVVHAYWPPFEGFILPTLAATFHPWGHQLLRTEPVSLDQGAILLLLALTIFPTMELHKWLWVRRQKRAQATAAGGGRH